MQCLGNKAETGKWFKELEHKLCTGDAQDLLGVPGMILEWLHRSENLRGEHCWMWPQNTPIKQQEYHSLVQSLTKTNSNCKRLNPPQKQTNKQQQQQKGQRDSIVGRVFAQS